MSGDRREYRFHGLNESEGPAAAPGRGGRYSSRVSCCGLNLWDLSCDAGYCRCSVGACAVQFSRPADATPVSLRYRVLLAMANGFAISLLVFLVVYYFLQAGAHADSNKYRVCVVDGKNGYKRAGLYCPILDKPDSKVECVIGVDRLDCLRRISKGKVDFAVFTAEDLITATNAQAEVLITNELRFTPQKFEYDVVAIVADDAGINSKYDLQDKKFCHPGYGYQVEWTRILANFLEATVVPKSCDESLTLTENRIKASSQYFRAACKAGPWVTDNILDQQLKRKYPNLCSLCGAPGRCSTSDKYWGRRGSLYCLTDGAGDVSWARLDDAQAHFGITPGAQASAPDGYSYLCPDGTRRPVNGSKPCAWVSKPWPVIAAKRTSAQEIQGFINRLEHTDEASWQHALLNLIESYHVDMSSVSPIQAIEGYLINTPGFQSANSFSGCHPPRSIRVCTTSNLENAKCGWMREAAAVYGVEPDFECVKADNKTHCMQAIQLELADVMLVHPDMTMTARRDYGMKTLLYEDVKPEARYEPVALVKKDSGLRRWEDLRGKRACFPSYEGIAWNSMLFELHRRGLLSYECPYSAKAASFFGASCAPLLPRSAPASLRQLCASAAYQGDFGALKCLVLEDADVAFVSKHSVKQLLAGQLAAEPWVERLMAGGTRVLCPDELKPCALSWSTVGEFMIRGSASDMAVHEAFDAFMRVDELFGTEYKSLTRAFSLYGPFDGTHNVLFDDQTVRLRDRQYLLQQELSVPSYDDVLQEVAVCVTAAAPLPRPLPAATMSIAIALFSTMYIKYQFVC